MRKIAIIIVAVLLLVLSATAEDLKGTGRNDDPWRWEGGRIGVGNSCQVFIWTNTWMRGSVQLPQLTTQGGIVGGIHYEGTGESNNPFRIEDDVKGLTCTVASRGTNVRIAYWHNNKWNEQPSPQVQAGTASAGVTQQARFLTYNIRFGCGNDRDCTGDDNNVQKIAEVINDIQPDIAALQETSGSYNGESFDVLNSLKAKLADYNVYPSGSQALLVKKNHRLLKGQEKQDYAQGNRYYLRSEVLLNEIPYVIFQTHLMRSPFKDSNAACKSQSEANDYNAALSQLAQLANAVRAEGTERPIVLLADLNLNPEQVRSLSQVLWDATQDIDVTFPTKSYCDPRNQYGQFDAEEKIDYIFTSSALQSHSAGRYEVEDASDASDHYPLFADVSFTGTYTPAVEALPEEVSGVEAVLPSEPDFFASSTSSLISRKIDEAWSFKLAPALGRESNVWDTRLSLPQWKPFLEVYPAPVAPLGIPGVALSPEVQKMREIYRNYKQYIDAAATKYSIPVSLLVAVIFKESGGDPRAVSAGGAAGLMQMVPATFMEMGGKVAFVGVSIPDNLNANGYRDFMNRGQHWGTCNGKAVSPCNSCQKGKCDFNNDQRFMPSIIIDFGAKYLAQRIMKQNNNIELGLQEYNGGSAKVQYAREILNFKQRFEQEGAAGCFPLEQSSLKRITNNFGSSRDEGKRCHAGIDILTSSPGKVVAIADGIVKLNQGGFTRCKEGWAARGTEYSVNQVLIYHPSLGKTVNYGEIDPGTIDSQIKLGATVQQGQSIGRAGYCGMLHLELYDGVVARDVSPWLPLAGQTVDMPNKCALQNYPKPQGLLDPTPLVRSLENKWCVMGVS